MPYFTTPALCVSLVLQNWWSWSATTDTGGDGKIIMTSNGHFKATANAWYVKLRTDIQFDTGRKADCGRPQAGQMRLQIFTYVLKPMFLLCRQDESATASNLISLCALELRVYTQIRMAKLFFGF